MSAIGGTGQVFSGLWIVCDVLGANNVFVWAVFFCDDVFRTSMLAAVLSANVVPPLPFFMFNTSRLQIEGGWVPRFLFSRCWISTPQQHVAASCLVEGRCVYLPLIFLSATKAAPWLPHLSLFERYLTK